VVWAAGIAPAGPDSRSLLLHKSYDAIQPARLDIGWEDAALRELAGKWHCLTPSVRATIMELARSEEVLGRGSEAG
jgi:hypothetical protein